MSKQFTLTPVDFPLPRGAFTGGGRDILRLKDRPLCAFSRSSFRPSLHPVWTPAGHVVTAEQPVDHPHHRGIWVGSDHIGLLVHGPDGIERYDYCFYTDQVFQGRAPGHIRQSSVELLAQKENVGLVRQSLNWIGPAEWGSDGGRRVLNEVRWTAVTVTKSALILDITSEVTPADNTPVALGPTRHAWFNARLADGIALDPSSVAQCDGGGRGAKNIPIRETAWVDLSGPVGGGLVAGISVAPVVPQGSTWFVADWGVITVGHIRNEAIVLQPKERTRFACRMVAHDGGAPALDDTFKDTPFVTPENLITANSGNSL